VIEGEGEGRIVEVGLVVDPGVSLGEDKGELETVCVFSTVGDWLGAVVVGDGSSRLPAASPEEVGIEITRDRKRIKNPAHMIPRAGHVRRSSRAIISPYDPSVIALS
jgi:hypothetical protein